MTSQRHFSFSFPEEMDGLIDFLFVRSFFLGLQKYQNLFYTPWSSTMIRGR